MNTKTHTSVAAMIPIVAGSTIAPTVVPGTSGRSQGRAWNAQEILKIPDDDDDAGSLAAYGVCHAMVQSRPTSRVRPHDDHVRLNPGGRVEDRVRRFPGHGEETRPDLACTGELSSGAQRLVREPGGAFRGTACTKTRSLPRAAARSTALRAAVARGLGSVRCTEDWAHPSDVRAHRIMSDSRDRRSCSGNAQRRRAGAPRGSLR